MEPPAGLDPGYVVRPTVFANVRNEMTIAQEAIFGPVLTMIPYDTEEDAMRLANETPYGLAGGVWSGDPERATRVARRLRAGQMSINSARYNPHAPCGGYKQSGNGWGCGTWGLAEYLETKSLQL
jgi:aldehyde dehydrogenase (NAD+)